jgi:hypothetical protein
VVEGLQEFTFIFGLYGLGCLQINGTLSIRLLVDLYVVIETSRIYVRMWTYVRVVCTQTPV